METTKPKEIETRSFEIITEELRNRVLDPTNAPIIKRVIHTSADFDYAENLCFSHRAVPAALKALKLGVDIVTDTNMAKAGINKKALAKLGGTAHCFMADEDVSEEASKRDVTRATVSMEKAALLGGKPIVAVGNAPTALIRLKELCHSGEITPSLVIAVPVGFVNVVEAKELFIDCDFPTIVARGRKGGSNIAAAICNGLIYICEKEEKQ